MSANPRGKKLLVVLAAIAVSLLAWRQFGPARTPSPQPPMQALEAANLRDFQNVFNSASSETRLILLFSPT